MCYVVSTELILIGFFDTILTCVLSTALLPKAFAVFKRDKVEGRTLQSSMIRRKCQSVVNMKVSNRLEQRRWNNAFIKISI